jgi:hypothetical protein
MRLKADLLLFMVAIIWGTAFVAQGIAGRYEIAAISSPYCGTPAPSMRHSEGASVVKH